ncbi:uncharacterized protein LOC126335650 [Schistocerca gregaria]|uniref:uncharacterized protein LOC126335650 n=1 Tax=Schistocerca gregaria TaxID=7010 RepID=UPI00211DBB4C|nr:uncharacterized protein LOC126335650 [Schistocerca gregaria]
MDYRVGGGGRAKAHQRIVQTPSVATRTDGGRPPPAQTEPPDIGYALRPLVALSALVGVPPCRPSRSALLDAASRAYSLAVVGCLAYMGYATAAYIVEAYGAACHSYYVPEFVGRSVVSCAACVSVLSLLLARGDWLSVFSAEIRHVDDLLAVDKWKAHRATKFYLFTSLGLLLAGYTGNVVWDVIVISPYDALVEIIDFVIVVTFEQFLVFALIIKYRFLLLNETVLHLFRSQLKTFREMNVPTIKSVQCHLPYRHPSALDDSPKQSTWPVSCDQLLTIKVVHMKLTKLADALNDVYTVPITVMAFQALVTIVQVVFNILLCLLDQDEENDTIILPDLCYLLMTVTSVLVLTYCCQSTTSQARRTASIAEDLVLANTAVGGSEAFSQQLRELSRQVRHNPVVFSACSLFSVDASLLMGFMSTVATYSIILLQFVVSNKGCPLGGGPANSMGVDVNETTSSTAEDT